MKKGNKHRRRYILAALILLGVVGTVWILFYRERGRSDQLASDTTKARRLQSWGSSDLLRLAKSHVGGASTTNVGIHLPESTAPDKNPPLNAHDSLATGIKLPVYTAGLSASDATGVAVVDMDRLVEARVSPARSPEELAAAITEIKSAIAAIAAKRKLAFVFDKKALSAKDTPILLVAEDSLDITELVLQRAAP